MEPGPHQHTSILLLTTYLQLRAATSSKTRNSLVLLYLKTAAKTRKSICSTMMRMLNARCEVFGLVASSYHVTTPASDLIYQLTHVPGPRHWRFSSIFACLWTILLSTLAYSSIGIFISNIYKTWWTLVWCDSERQKRLWS